MALLSDVSPSQFCVSVPRAVLAPLCAQEAVPPWGAAPPQSAVSQELLTNIPVSDIPLLIAWTVFKQALSSPPIWESIV